MSMSHQNHWRCEELLFTFIPNCALLKAQMLRDLPVLSEENKLSLENDVPFEEVSRAVMGLSSGRCPGINGLPTSFTRLFGQDQL